MINFDLLACHVYWSGNRRASIMTNQENLRFLSCEQNNKEGLQRYCSPSLIFYGCAVYCLLLYRLATSEADSAVLYILILSIEPVKYPIQVLLEYVSTILAAS